MRQITRHLVAPGLALVVWLAAPLACATERMAREIEQLLTFVENSQCQFVRNGSAYSAQQARAHLEKKQAYLQRKKLLTRTEDFIELAATQSSMSGKAYEIRCAAGVQLAGGWLEAELQRIRRNE